MQQHIKLIEKLSITQRQALLATLGLYFLGTMSLVALKFTASKHDSGILLSAGLIATVLFDGAWFLYYRYRWEPVRYFAAITATLVVALFLPEPFVSTYAPMAILIPIVLSLVVAGGVSVVLNSVLMIAILLVRAGGSGVYMHPSTLTIYAMIVGGLLVRRLIEASAFHQLKQAQESIKQSERQLQALLASLDDMVFQFDEQAILLSVWTADDSLLARPKDQLLGKKIAEVLGEEPGRHFEDAVRRVVHSGQPESMEYSLEISGRHWFDARLNAIPDPGGASTVCMLIRDVTGQKQMEQVYASGQKRFQSLIEHAPDGIALLDRNGVLKQVTPSSERILGYGTDEAEGQDPAALTHPEDMPALRALLADLMQTPGRVARAEYRIRHKDGSWRWLDSTISNLMAEPGVEAMVFNYRDVTERKQAEAVLQASEERYRLLFEENPLPLLVYDTDSLRFLAVNDVAVTQYGYERAELLQMTIREIRPPEELSRLEAFLDRPRPRQERSGPWKQRKKDGTLFDVEVVSNETSFLGRPARLVLPNDITEQLQAKAALAASELRFRSLIENSADGITVVSDRGTVTYVSPSIERLLGYTPVEAIGRQAIEDVHPEDRAHLLEHVAQVEKAHTGYQVVQFRFKHRNGSWHWLESSITLQVDQPDSQSFVFNYRDISERKQAESELQASESRYRLATRATNDVIWEWSAATNQLAWSENAQLVFGYSAEDIGGNAAWWDDHIHPEDRPRVMAGLDALINGSESVWLDEYRFRLKDGSYATVSDHGYVEREANGKANRLIGAMSDITKRRQAESKLQTSETRYRLATRVTNDVIWEWNAATDQIAWAENAQIVFGYSLEEIGDDTGWWDDHIHPEDRQRVTSGLQKVMAGKETVWSDEYRFLLKKGSYAILQDRGYIERDGTGKAIRMIGAISDITRRRQAEESLANSERRFRALIENGLDYISLLSAKGALLWESPSNTRMLNYRPDEMLGRSVFDLVHPQDLDMVHQQFAGLCREPGGQKASVFRIRNAAGTWLWVEAVATNLLHVPSVGAIVLNYRDVTERKQAEEQLHLLNLELEKRVTERTTELNRTNAELEHASRAKDEFLANMSHELRTPLNSILGLSESLLEQRRGALNEHQQHSLGVIESSGRHLLELINDILDLSKIEAGKFDFYPETILVEDLIHSSLVFVKSQALKKSIRLSYEADPAISRIQADPRRLKQILVNLLNNAVKFTPEHGQVLLLVHANAGENLIQFSVIDSGIGIAPTDLARLFRPFEQVDNQLNRQFDGTGLGLALVQKLTDLHGGSVHVKSEVGKGSCFTINLPWKQEELHPGGKTGSPQSVPSFLHTGTPEKSADAITILLAEDHVANVLTIGEYLESHGYRVIVAHDGVEALEMAQEADPDLILMDVQMPVIDGLEATRRLRAQARFARTPVVALTALAMPGDRERCLQAGANEYLSKPVSLKNLVHTIQQLLLQKRPASRL